MSSGLNWYPNTSEITPWNATYQFPSAANQTQMTTPRITSPGTFSPTQTTSIECPAVGYCNPDHTYLTFDFTIFPGSTGSVRVQNGISSAIKRLTIKYGGSVLEDLDHYNDIARFLQETSGTNQNGIMDHNSIAEGSGGYTLDIDGSGNYFGLANVREKYIHGRSVAVPGVGAANFSGGAGWGNVPGGSSNPINAVGPSGSLAPITRRYTISLLAGLFVQNKLLPFKYMASSFTIDITWADAKECLYTPITGGTAPTYAVGNVALLPEILEFTPAYDNDFTKNGLLANGVAIPFCSFQTHSYSSANSSSINLRLSARSRSIKAIFVLQKRAIRDFQYDSGASFFDTSIDGNSTLQTFQVQAGGKLYPAAPYQCSSAGYTIPNGAAEAFTALQVALAINGDYKLSSSVNPQNWDVLPSATGVLCEYDYDTSISSYDSASRPVYSFIRSATNTFSGTCPSAQFAMGVTLETSSGLELSGLNGVEQNDITVMAKWAKPQVTGASNTASEFLVLVFYDAMLVLEAFNGMKLIA